MTSPVKIGDVIDNKYKVEGILGEGGMGVVVAALHLELDLRVALKFLLPEAFSNLEAVQRFIREARAAAKIKSEHVARILDTGRLEDGSPFQVMELLDGEDLAKVLGTRGAVAVEDAVSYVLQASEALAEAHAVGIVHRDLKPANLFLARKPDRTTILKVLDFGISKNLASTEKGLTRSNAIVGSPFYMSPEQLTYGREVDARSDIWSLGIILYELISGTTPFGGETLPQVVAGILLNKPRTVGELRPGLPPAVGAAITRCMMTEPADRYASVAELAHALAPYGPPSARESAERISRVLQHSHAPAALAPTMADPLSGGSPPGGAGTGPVGATAGATGGATGGAIGSDAAAARSHSGLSGTGAPWSRTGNSQAHSAPGGAPRSGKRAVIVAAIAGLASLAVLGSVAGLVLHAVGGAGRDAKAPPPTAALPATTTATSLGSGGSAVTTATPATSGVPDAHADPNPAAAAAIDAGAVGQVSPPDVARPRANESNGNGTADQKPKPPPSNEGQHPSTINKKPSLQGDYR